MTRPYRTPWTFAPGLGLTGLGQLSAVYGRVRGKLAGSSGGEVLAATAVAPQHRVSLPATDRA